MKIQLIPDHRNLFNDKYYFKQVWCIGIYGRLVVMTVASSTISRLKQDRSASLISTESLEKFPAGMVIIWYMSLPVKISRSCYGCGEVLAKGISISCIWKKFVVKKENSTVLVLSVENEHIEKSNV